MMNIPYDPYGQEREAGKPYLTSVRAPMVRFIWSGLFGQDYLTLTSGRGSSFNMVNILYAIKRNSFVLIIFYKVKNYHNSVTIWRERLMVRFT